MPSGNYFAELYGGHLRDGIVIIGYTSGGPERSILGKLAGVEVKIPAS